MLLLFVLGVMVCSDRRAALLVLAEKTVPTRRGGVPERRGIHRVGPGAPRLQRRRMTCRGGLKCIDGEMQGGLAEADGNCYSSAPHLREIRMNSSSSLCAAARRSVGASSAGPPHRPSRRRHGVVPVQGPPFKKVFVVGLARRISAISADSRT
jgi:hypothetical protein